MLADELLSYAERFAAQQCERLILQPVALRPRPEVMRPPWHVALHVDATCTAVHAFGAHFADTIT